MHRTEETPQTCRECGGEVTPKFGAQVVLSCDRCGAVAEVCQRPAAPARDAPLVVPEPPPLVQRFRS